MKKVKKSKRVVRVNMSAKMEKLRDDFAAAALSAIISKFPPMRFANRKASMQNALNTADGAYAYADAMLAARGQA
jgi:hypothetical protein